VDDQCRLRLGLAGEVALMAAIRRRSASSTRHFAEANKRTLSDYIRIVLEDHAEVQRERAGDAAKRKRPAS
jgi:hypothetical protein